MFEDITRQLTSIGGPVLAILFLISMVATATTIFKIIQFSRLGVGKHRAADAALAKWNVGEKKEAYDIASNGSAPLSRVAAQTMHSIGLSPNNPEVAREQAVHVAKGVLNQLAGYMRILESVVQAAPMLGLLGTVLGMIDAFGELAKGDGAVDPSQLAGGIFVALSTTALGLIIAIPFYFIANWLESRIESERVAMESTISAILFRTQSEKLTPTQTTGPWIGM
ncbi:MAG: MotA/TolQ/ExbB proton channel family protein [Spirochaetales bacterium]|nr:MotA/TolQ/ExbB proton channel family protein [Spirochaetales bacterium]